MKKCSVALLLGLVALFSAGCFVEFPARYTEIEQLTVPLSAGGTLHVISQNGEIIVRSGEVKEVQVTAEKTVRSRTDEEARQFCEDTKIATETSPSGAKVWVVQPEGYRHRAAIEVSIEAVVPRSCNVDLDTSNGRLETRRIDGNVKMDTSNGEIMGEDIRGDVLAETSNGSVRLEGVSGSAEVETSNGRVTIREAGGDIRSRTSNGDIELYRVVAGAEAVTSNGSITCELSGEVSADVSASAKHGKIRSDFPLTIEGDRLWGKIGDGKHSVQLKTSNGRIDLRKIE